MKLHATPLQGLFVFEGVRQQDSRGRFGKLYHADVFGAAGLQIEAREQFYSVSKRNVIRGLHFQVPPHDHVKLVACLQGRVLDVVVDLRQSHGSYGAVYSAELEPDNGRVLYIPSGFAHGFRALEDESIVLYTTSSVHHPESDRGVLWSSIEFDWGSPEAILSGRDLAFPTLQDFRSPFQ